MADEEKQDVLVVDDEKDILDLYKWILKDLGFFRNIVAAKDGVEALKKVSKQKFLLIITDLKMPNVEGLEFLEKILTISKAEEKDPPRIMISSGNVDSMVVKQAFKLGVRHILTKPFSKKTLEVKIREILNLKEELPPEV